MSDTFEADIVVIGAGVIGLAIAAKLSEKNSVVLLEHHPKFGQETSSRNSEVVHSGIYYPVQSKKTELCIKGRKLLYEFCEENGVPFLKAGKYVVSTQESEDAYLDKLAEHCQMVNVPFERVSGEIVMAAEPKIKVHSGVYLPQTGIVDSHSLMAVLERKFGEHGGTLVYRHRAKSFSKTGKQWTTIVDSPDGELAIESGIVVNAAGLGAAELSNQALGTLKYEHRYCRGRYFSLSGKYRNQFLHLVYPVPPKDGLGIHITIDLDGNARLGPDVDWCSGNYAQVNSLYDCDWPKLAPTFAAAAQRYCPEIKTEELAPGLIGIRPKLFVEGKALPDFTIENHDGFIHTLGIESPGLTASLALAERVASLVH